MKIIFYIIVVILSIGQYHKLDAQTNISGNISANTTWTKSGSPYILTGNVWVIGGATLTIESGVQVNLGNYNFHVGYWSSESGVLQ
ncbi:hypothetical protein, partial [Rosettibacter firmus]|uniref:hypothetical protein n=1 Tax=Rosettibacter firmus TaxID=3111522 RepID=UPI003EB46B0A